MHRPTVAILASILLTGGVYLSLVDHDDGFTAGLHAACWRVGGLLVAIWIAHPQLVRLPAWIYAVGCAAAVAIAVRPRLAIIVVPLVLAALWLRPRGRIESAKQHRHRND